MHPRLPVGTRGTYRAEVREEHTAHAMGNTGVRVLATPMVAGLFEHAATDALRPAMREGEISVGTVINVRHLRPTPVGMMVTATVTLREVRGARYLFDAVVFDEAGRAAEGEIERAIIDGRRFFRRLEERKPPRPA
jgi:fluoroacetyl-CoA thioesterase